MFTKDEARQRIAELVEKYTFQADVYERPDYNEIQCREDFINPLFTALGWDIENKEQAFHTYRSVRLEHRLVGDGSRRSLDYSFWLGKNRVCGGEVMTKEDITLMKKST
jgi:hypothetical protein